MFYILDTTLTPFILIFLGMACGAIKIFKHGDDRVLINYVFYIALPLNLFISCYHASWKIFNFSYLSSYSLSILIIIILSYFLSRKLGTGQQNSIIQTLCASQVDGAYFTIPLLEIILHNGSLAIPLMLVQNVIFLTLSLIWLQISIEPKEQHHSYFKFIFTRIYLILIRNPIIAASILGLVCVFLKINLPTTIEHSIAVIGDTSSAVALFSLGLTCVFYLNSLTQHRQLIQICILSSLKLLILPAIAAMIGIFWFPLPHNLLIALVLTTASPAATHTYIIANKYKCDTEIATFNVALTTILSFITINLWLYFI